jgi:hypothetical protein
MKGYYVETRASARSAVSGSGVDPRAARRKAMEEHGVSVLVTNERDDASEAPGRYATYETSDGLVGIEVEEGGRVYLRTRETLGDMWEAPDELRLVGGK